MPAMDMVQVIYSIFAALFGLAAGSFLNVVIHRIPIGQSVVIPGSHCPQCGAGVRAIDNIPLLSYALLGGRCRTCRTRISPVYPLVELLTAALFVWLLIKAGPTLAAMLQMLFACALLALIFIDVRHHLLPNVITYPAFLFAMAAAPALAVWSVETGGSFEFSIIFPALQTEFSASRAALIGAVLIALAAPGLRLLDWLDGILFNRYFEEEEIESEEFEREMAAERKTNRMILATMIVGFLLATAWAVTMLLASKQQPQLCSEAYNALLRAGWGALLGGGVIWWMRTLYFFIRGMEGMGLGDVKMMCGIGAFLGWQGAFSVLLIGSILGVVVGVILAFRSQKGLKTALPFGVCLGIAALVVMLM
jgi:prepilin signal peptidase PulO-like enzyme (type II secretory pathway)